MNRRGFVKTFFGGILGFAIVPAVPLLKGRPRHAELTSGVIDLDHQVFKFEGTHHGVQVSSYVKPMTHPRDVHLAGATFHLPVVDRWYQIMVWYDPSGHMRAFVDGVEQKT